MIFLCLYIYGGLLFSLLHEMLMTYRKKEVTWKTRAMLVFLWPFYHVIKKE